MTNNPDMYENTPALPSPPVGEATGRPSITFENITFSDGTVIELGSEDIVVFVGPNNAGKSAALRELEEHIGGANQPKTISSVSLLKKGTTDELKDFIADRYEVTGNNQCFGMGMNVQGFSVEDPWKHELSLLRPIFCQKLATESRIFGSNAVNAIDTLNKPATHPIHLLYDDDEAEKRVSSYFQKAFGEELIVYHGGGSSFPLLVGKSPERGQGEFRDSKSYKTRLLDATVPLGKQGDGMRSFASVILHLLVHDSYSVMLLDEPEAFLHPLQARLIGEIIAKERPKDTQLFIATHSQDVLAGLLNVAPDNLRILRIEREGNINHVRELSKERAKEIAADPLLKYSSVFSGLFHKRVIVCEADGDCQFYSAILDLPEVNGGQPPDVLFVHAAGKDRMHILAKVLQELGVRVDVIADIDMLRDEDKLKELVAALGGTDWNVLEKNWTPLINVIDKLKPELDASGIKKKIEGILGDVSGTEPFPRNKQKEIGRIFKKASAWDRVKQSGKTALPSGGATNHFTKLTGELEKLGLWIVSVGEIEGFCKSVGGHGPKWVRDVLERKDLSSKDVEDGQEDELKKAREFIKKIWRA